MLSRDRLIRTAGLLAITALIAGACNTAAANKNSGLANTEWLLSTMDGAPIASGTNVTLGFGLAQASGNSGCNDYTTSYQVSGNRDLTFGDVAATRKLCDAAANAVEAKYYASLALVVRFGLAGGGLTLLDRTNSAVLTFAPAPAQSLVGPWIATAVNNGSGGVTSVPAGVTGAVSFFADGHLEGFGGCNNFSGSYTVKGDSLTVGPMMSTMMACPDPAGTFETQFLTALQNSTKWSVSAGKLDLRDDTGAQQVAAETAIK
jgi:heat shock protein HslJ